MSSQAILNPSLKSTPGMVPAWFVTVGSMVAALAALLFVFRERIAALTLQNQSIGYFVLAAASVLLLLGVRRSFITANFRDVGIGSLITALGLGGLVLLDAWKRPIVSSTPTLIAITAFGIVWALFGRSEAWRQRFPIGYLLLMTPLPVVLVIMIDLPLQVLSTSLACRTVRLIGVAVEQFGTTVRLHNSELSLRIIGDCNGLRSAFAMFAVALLLGWMLQASYPKKVVLLTAGLAFAYAGNILRLTTILVLMNHYGQKFVAILPRFEAWYGALVFAAAVGLLFLTARWMGCARFREI